VNHLHPAKTEIDNSCLTNYIFPNRTNYEGNFYLLNFASKIDTLYLLNKLFLQFI